MDTQVIFVPLVLLREVRRMFKIACLSAHTNGGLEVERGFVICPVP